MHRCHSRRHARSEASATAERQMSGFGGLSAWTARSRRCSPLNSHACTPIGPKGPGGLSRGDRHDGGGVAAGPCRPDVGERDRPGVLQHRLGGPGHSATRAGRGNATGPFPRRPGHCGTCVERATAGLGEQARTADGAVLVREGHRATRAPRGSAARAGQEGRPCTARCSRNSAATWTEGGHAWME